MMMAQGLAQKIASIFSDLLSYGREARDRESGGTGLGLAIVETAISQHRGHVKADDSPLGGLRVEIWLPREVLAQAINYNYHF